MTLTAGSPLELLSVARERLATVGWCKHDMVRYPEGSDYWDSSRKPVAFCTLGALAHGTSACDGNVRDAAKLLKAKVVQLDPDNPLIHTSWTEDDTLVPTISIPRWNDSRSDVSEVLAVLDAVIDDLIKEYRS